MLIGEFEDAINVLEKAVKFHKRAELYYQLSNSFLNVGEEEHGQNALKMALELDSSLSDDMQQKYPYIKDQVKKVKSKKK
jgi:uncharacterized protein HemY